MNSRKIWEVLSQLSDDKASFTEDNLIQTLLENRGLKSTNEIDNFLHPTLEDVTTASVGIDHTQLTKACTRIKKAIENKEKIVVFGDYDVDGITGTAILWESLHAIGAEVIPYIPHRVDEGYGLSIKGIQNVILNNESKKESEGSPSVKNDSSPALQNDKIGLIITVDNGIVAHEAVAFAKEKNIDVIITDHHTIGESLPDAFAIVHTTAICGAAVGWLFAKEIAQENIPEDLLSLVALATVADLVPLIGASRTLLKFGLKVLQKTQRPGLLALFAEAKIEPNTIDVYTIGHMIGPRLNAMGRLESAMDSLRLLCTPNKTRARELAQKLELTNKERQVLTSSMVEHAKQQVFALSKKAKILFIHHETYEEGVIGLVAGKLVETFYLPAIVLSKGEKYSKASARSIAGFNIIEAIRSASDLLVNAGGHPMAAGFTVETEKLELLKEALEQVADGAVNETMLKRILRIDLEISLEVVNKSVFTAIQKLSPFGMACPEPVFVSEVIVREVRQIGMDGKHLKMSVSPVSGAPMTFEAIAFGMGECIADLKKGTKAKIAYTIDENTWNGRTNLQLKIKDILC